MELIKADHHRLLQLAGVPDPVHRPVDIDPLQTGFASLRSLRIYCFNAGSVIDGHAEDDEVLIVVLAGSVQLTMSERDLEESSPRFTLSAVGNSQGHPCAAYLPPNGAYRLIPQVNVEVAYARATPSSGRAPTIFSAEVRSEDAGDFVLFEEANYPQRLRLRVVQLKAADDGLTVTPVMPSESSFEALVHVRTAPAHEAVTIKAAGIEPIALESWDTVCLMPGERPTLRVARASSALLLVVLASA